jgi:hypothetical protein
MGFHDRAVDQIQTVAQFRCQRIENLLPDAASRPTVEAIVRRRIRPVAFRQIARRHASAQHIKYRFHDLSIVSAGTSSTCRRQRLKKSPFVIAQIKSHDPPPITVNHDHYDFSRSYVSTDPNYIGHGVWLYYRPKRSNKAAICTSIADRATLAGATSVSLTFQNSIYGAQYGKRSSMSGRCSDSLRATMQSAVSRSAIAHCCGNRSLYFAINPRTSRPFNVNGDIGPALLANRSIASARDLASQFIPVRAARWLKSSSANRLRK